MNKSMLLEEWDLVKHENDVTDVIEHNNQDIHDGTKLNNIPNELVTLHVDTSSLVQSVDKQNECVLNSEVKAMMTDFHDITLDLKKKILELEEEKKRERAGVVATQLGFQFVPKEEVKKVPKEPPKNRIFKTGDGTYRAVTEQEAEKLEEEGVGSDVTDED